MMNELKQELLTYLKKEDLIRSTLLIGKVLDSNFDLMPYVERIMQLSESVFRGNQKLRKDSVFVAEKINDLLFVDLGFKGKTEEYKKIIDDPNQYYMHLLLDNKQADALAYAILYYILLTELGVECECLAFPSTYLLKVKDVATDFYVDPFAKGKFLSQSEFRRKFKAAMERNRLLSTNLYEVLTPYQMVVRLIQRLKQTYILKNDTLHAVRAVELLTALFPESPELTRDRGILYCEMEYFSKAVEDLTFYLRSRPKADDVKEIRKLTSMLRGYRETIN